MLAPLSFRITMFEVFSCGTMISAILLDLAFISKSDTRPMAAMTTSQNMAPDENRINLLRIGRSVNVRAFISFLRISFIYFQ